MEMMRVSRDPARRKAIFENLSQQPVLIHQVIEALLLQLGKRFNTLQTRGGLVATAKPAAPIKPSGPDPRTIQVQQADIFRPSARASSVVGSTLQNVLDGPVVAPPDWTAKIDPSVVGPKVMGQVEGVAGEALKMIEGKPYGGQVLDGGRGFLASLNGWTGREWARSNVAISVPDPMIITWIVDGESAEAQCKLTTSSRNDRGSFTRRRPVRPGPIRPSRHARIHRPHPYSPQTARSGIAWSSGGARQSGGCGAHRSEAVGGASRGGM